MRATSVLGGSFVAAFWRALGVLGVCCTVLAIVATGARAAQIEGELGFAGTSNGKLEAEINPQGVDTTCHAEYASQQAYEAEGWTDATVVPCAPQELGAGTSPVPVSASIPSGLSLGAIYDYRFVAVSGGATLDGATETFTTFGLGVFGFGDLNTEGLEDATAGAHPYELNLNFVLAGNWTKAGDGTSNGNLKDLITQLPPGLIGDPAATPRCPQALEEVDECPADTQIGLIQVGLPGDARKGKPEEAAYPHPLFNLVPPRGVVARFGVVINAGVSAYIDAGVRTGSDYGVTAGSYNTTDFAQAKHIILKMWGVPASPAHPPERSCPEAEAAELEKEGVKLEEGVLGYKQDCPSRAPLKPFLRNPTSCHGAMPVAALVDSYEEPGEFAPAKQVSLPGQVECAALPFAPSIESSASTGLADSPTGMHIDLHIPQHEEAEHLATSDLKDATVTLPAGVAVDPSSANGLGACSEKQVGFTGFTELDPEAEPGVKTSQFTEGPAECPDASKIASVTLHTPLIEHPLPGAMYLAAQKANPFGSLLAVYLTVYDPVTGIVIKLPGVVQANTTSGQLTATFEQNPQLPFEDLEVELFGAKEPVAHSRAPLSSPETCGAYVTSSVLTPWDGNPAVTPVSKAFQITGEPGGGACAATEAQAANAPGLQAGTESPIAGTFSPFVLKMTREDGSQRFGALNVTLPPGMLGKVAGVQQCPQTDIEAAERLSHEGQGAIEQASPSCPAGSLLGVVHVGAGSGKPLYVNGRVYFAGPYKGAPFSLVIVTPAVAGPFDLGTVVVRAALFIDPETAQVTVRSDPFPSILDGIPLDIRSVGVEMTRPDFTLNPTSCNPMEVTGQEISTAGQAAALKDRFQVGGCNGMPFNPTFTAMVQAHHSRKEGAYFKASVEAHAGQANISKVEVQLPKALSVRDETLKQACSEAQFASNPAGCPAGSFVGSATAYTPILNVPLSGPAIFVSHGGKQFPDMDVVLQGEGVTIKLRSGTFVDKAGYTFSKFEGVPDAPISRFELTLPPGPHSALAGNGNLCYRTITKNKRVLLRKHGHLIKRHKHLVHKTKKIHHTVKRLLQMPTLMIGQNGVDVHQKTHLTVTGCGKAHTSGHKHHSKHHKKHNKHKKHRHKGKHKHGKAAGHHHAHKHHGRRG